MRIKTQDAPATTADAPTILTANRHNNQKDYTLAGVRVQVGRE